MSDDNVNAVLNILSFEVAVPVMRARHDLEELRSLAAGDARRADTALQALEAARSAVAALARAVERLEREASEARSAWLDADPGRCDMSGPVCPEHGVTVVVIDGRNACIRRGCEQGAAVAREDWDHCSALAVVVITDAAGSDELRVCRGHLVDARARLDGLRIVELADPPPDDDQR